MIELKNISHGYNNEKVLKNINLSIEDGEFVSIMGASGSGKTTLLNVIGGFITPDQGEVLWNGESLAAKNEKQASEFRAKEMGFMFQSFKLLSTLTAAENAQLSAYVAGVGAKETQKRLVELAEKLSLADYLDKFPDQLSGGQQQRVALIRALIAKPEVVILDEPTGALDSKMQVKVMELLTEINKSGTTIIQVTHSPEMARYGTRTILIKDGEICG